MSRALVYQYVINTSSLLKLAYLFNMSIYSAVQNNSISMSMDLMNSGELDGSGNIIVSQLFGQRRFYSFIYALRCGYKGDTKSSSYPRTSLGF